MRRSTVVLPVLAMLALAIAACNDGHSRSSRGLLSSTPAATEQPSLAGQPTRSAGANPHNAPTVTANVIRWKLPEPVAREVVDRIGARAIVAAGWG